MKFDIGNLQKFDKKNKVSLKLDMHNGSFTLRDMYTSDNKSNPCTWLDRPLELQKIEAPIISRQSVYVGPGDTAYTHYWYRLTQPQGGSAAIYDNISLNCS